MSSSSDSLVELLMELFTKEELRKFVAHYRHGKVILQKLPKKAQSDYDVAYYVVKAWGQKGLIAEDLAQRLSVARPKSARMIEEVFEELLEDEDYLDENDDDDDDDDDDRLDSEFDEDDDLDDDDDDFDGDLDDEDFDEDEDFEEGDEEDFDGDDDEGGGKKGGRDDDW
ncbi:hypothetical protein L6R49_01585 [Myxococcota bacterium]|nr:hypothetical protein [Myxococcota bacterium]